MNKRIILVSLISLVLIVGVFVLTGCGSSKEQTADSAKQNEASTPSSSLDKEEVVNKLHFKYSSKANIKDSTNGKIVENEYYNIIVSHQKNKTVSELENARKFSSVGTESFNSVDWKKYSYSDSQVKSTVYMYEKDDGTHM